jgi:hypothetical protein
MSPKLETAASQLKASTNEQMHAWMDVDMHACILDHVASAITTNQSNDIFASKQHSFLSSFI